MRMQKQLFFALTAWRLGGACVRRAAMTLAVMLMTVTAWAIGITVNVTGAGSVKVAATSLHSEVTATATAGTPATVTTEANDNESVNMTFEPGEGYIVTSAQYTYTLKDGNSWIKSTFNITVDGTTGTFNMPSSSSIRSGTGVTVDITFDHILEGGVDEASAVDITDDTVTKLSGGYYTISSDITFDHTITLSGNTVLTLASGKTMTINTSEDNGIYGNKYSLTVGGEGSMSVTAGMNAIYYITDYTQTGGNVTLSAKNYGLKTHNHSATISGGTLSANGTGNSGIGIKSYDVIISGGSVSATGTNYGINGNYVSITGGVVIAQGDIYSDIYGDNGLSITGGQVTAVTKGISNQNNGITLGCNNATDFIKASSYSSYVGTVKIADDQTLYGSDFPSTSFTGTIDDPSVLNGQTLRPSAAVTESGTNEYTIWNAYGWDAFCDRLAADDGKSFFSGKTVKLGADITVSRMAGADNHDFLGTFDGQGNKLTFTATATANYLAPFRNVLGNSTDDHAVIRNLKVETNITANDYRHTAGLIAQVWGYVDVINCDVTVNINSTKGSTNTDLYPAGIATQVVSSAQLTVSGCTVGGTISTDGKYAGGIVGIVQGSASITDCVSSVTIDSSTSGDGTHGGIVAVQGNYDGSTITIEGCVFNGCLLGSSTTCCGGFVGWRSKTVTISNSLFDPAEVSINTTEGNTPCATFVRNGNSTPTNSYYITTLGTAQGKQARSITAGGNVTTNGTYLESEAVTIDHAGVPTAYTTSGITAYKATENSSTFIAGILYNEVLYAGNGDEVSLTLSNTPPDGYGFDSYTTLPKSTTLTEDGDNYTLTIPNENVRIMAMFAPLPITVRYIDERGVEQTVDALDLSKFDGVIPAGSVCSFSSEDLANVNFRIGGDVTIILLDDFELRIENIDGNHTITFYGQEKGNGKLYVTKSIYNNVTVYAGSITVGVDEESEGNVYGTVTVHGGSLTNRGNVIGNSVNSVTVDGGSFTNGGYVNSAVTVSGGSFTNGGDVNGAVTVSGGSFTNGGDVNGNVTVDGGNVHIDGTINNVEELSWTKPSDSFYAATIKGSVEIPEDKIFYDEDGKHYSGIIALDYETETNPIDGKTLRPYDCRLSLSDAASNSTAIDNANGLVYNVTLSGRTLYKDGKWNTLCLPFDVTVGSGQMEDATAMTFDGETSGFVASTGVLTLNFVGVDEGRTITAGTPFIVKWTGTDVTNPVFSGVTVSSTTAGSVPSSDGKVQFVGTYSQKDIYSDAHDNLYLGAANTLYWPSTEGFTLGACRAYFHVDSEVQSKVRAFVLNFDEDEATGILSTTDDTDFTDSDDAWYDLSGRKLSGKPSQRGVYIRGGRKVAIQ